MIRILCIVFFLVPKLLLAQADLRAAFTNAIRDNDAKLLLRYDARNGFISNTYAKINGVKIGANYGRFLSLGVGYNFIWRAIKFDAPSRTLSLYYIAPFIEYKFYNKHPFYASIPLQVGIGSLRVRSSDLAFNKESTLFTYEVMLNGEFRFLKYFGTGAGLGYRLFFYDRGEIAHNFNSPVYVLKFNCYFEDIYNDIRKK